MEKNDTLDGALTAGKCKLEKAVVANWGPDVVIPWSIGIE
jgi:hypothetical protein